MAQIPKELFSLLSEVQTVREMVVRIISNNYRMLYWWRKLIDDKYLTPTTSTT